MSFKVIKSPLSKREKLAPFKYERIGGTVAGANRGAFPFQYSNESNSAGALSTHENDPEMKGGGKGSIDQIKQTAFEEGYLKGQRAGREEAEKGLEAPLSRFADSLEEVSKLKKKLYGEVEKDALKLAIEIAKKIVRHQVQIDPDIALALIKVAIDRINEKTSLVIRVSPLDYEWVLQRKRTLCDKDNADGIVIEVDTSLQRGGCIIESDHGHVDARIDTQFKELELGLYEIAPK